MLHAHKEIQAATGMSIASESQEVQRRACARIHVPRALRWEMVGELEIERDERSVVADPDFDIRSKPQAVDERRRLDVAAKIELVGVGGYAGPSADRLRVRGRCEGGYQESRKQSRSRSPDNITFVHKTDDSASRPSRGACSTDSG